MPTASIAAIWQASVGNVAAGSTFATLESAAMSGYGLVFVETAVQALGTAMIAASVAETISS